ncbi:YheC/YheD family protein [Salinithrix halophila]|uniref:YheC/YheD family protein n=1 Tax=Salinithrix halophila TaxID=1485204 RepID=A0ABV8JFA0_9BACL
MGKKGYKMGVHRTLMGDAALAPALPETRWFNEENLWGLLERYRSVILKPSGGTGGYGVIQVTALGDGRLEVRFGPRRQVFINQKAALTRIKQGMQHRTLYLVQQRISLIEVGGCPVDIRVMVQRKKGSPWQVTGHLAKVAGQGYIVTNIARSGGKVLPVHRAITLSSAKGISPNRAVRDLCDTALRAAQRLGRFSPRSLIAGFDMGVDRKGKVWIIEANPKPALSLFLKLKDKSMYRRIISFPRGYG